MKEFIKSNSWASEDLSEFSTAWSALTDIEREETRTSGDLEHLFQAISRELNAQQVLAALDESGAAGEASLQIHALGTSVGMGERLPDLVEQPTSTVAEIESFELMTVGAPVVDDGGETDLGDTTISESVELDTESLELPPLKSAAQTDLTRVESTQDLGTDQVDSSGYTIQLFALSSLENVQAVLASHQNVALSVVSLPESAAPHRIVYGSYETPADALAAYAELPATLTQNRAKPIIKSRESLRITQASVGAHTIQQLGKSEQWLRSQSREEFTLQLFALNADHNVEQVLGEHPDLDLRVHYSDNARSRFRILYGAYNTPEAALEAFQALPKL